MSTFLTGIDHIQIAAPKGSEDKARAFYGEILGMKEIPKPENLQGRGGCWFKVGVAGSAYRHPTRFYASEKSPSRIYRECA